MAKKDGEIKVDEESYLMLLNKILKNKESERELALDRYRKADESITTTDHFVVMGKNAVSYLRLASDATNDIANLAKEIKSIVFKESDAPPSNASVVNNDESMRMIIDRIKEDEGGLSRDDRDELMKD